MVKVLFDHNMPPAMARGLNAIINVDGHEAFALRDKFPIDIGDIDYFHHLGRQGSWVVISKDLSNATKRAERQAILSNNLLAFYLSRSLQKKTLTQQAAAILWHWDAILQQSQLVSRGLFQLPENKGKLKSL